VAGPHSDQSAARLNDAFGRSFEHIIEVPIDTDRIVMLNGAPEQLARSRQLQRRQFENPGKDKTMPPIQQAARALSTEVSRRQRV
jgi:hypothetical protein